MSESFQCPKCAARYALKENLAGKGVKCRKCGTAFRVPAMPTPSAPGRPHPPADPPPIVPQPSRWVLSENDKKILRAGAFMAAIGIIAIVLPLFGVQFRRFARLGDALPYVAAAFAVAGAALVFFSLRRNLAMAGSTAGGILLVLIAVQSASWIVGPEETENPSASGQVVDDGRNQPGGSFSPGEHLSANWEKERRELLDRDEPRWEMISRYGAENVVAVDVRELPAGTAEFVTERIRTISACESFFGFSSKDVYLHSIAPVADLQALAEAIDFGEVVHIDSQQRIITVAADPSKLPEPLPPAISDPNDPDFYRRNLADLTCWSKYRRRAAAVALSRAEPKELRTEIAGALESLLDDADSGIRHDAAAALGAWGRTEPLIRLLGDEDGGVREQALRSLVDSQDPRAAVAIAKMLTTDHGSVEGHLQQLGPAAEDAVLVYLDHEEPEVRKRACRVLGNIGTQKSIARLSELAGGGDLVMSQLAAAALRQIQTRAGTGRSNEIRIGPAPPGFPGP